MSNADISRREFLASLAAAGMQAGRSAQSTSVRIDVHHHIVPPALIQAWGAQRMGAASANWSPSKAMEELEQGGVSTGMTSIAPAGDPFNDPSTAVRLCRECNEYATRLAADHPRRCPVCKTGRLTRTQVLTAAACVCLPAPLIADTS